MEGESFWDPQAQPANPYRWIDTDGGRHASRIEYFISAPVVLGNANDDPGYAIAGPCVVINVGSGECYATGAPYGPDAIAPAPLAGTLRIRVYRTATSIALESSRLSVMPVFARTFDARAQVLADPDPTLRQRSDTVTLTVRASGLSGRAYWLVASNTQDGGHRHQAGTPPRPLGRFLQPGANVQPAGAGTPDSIRVIVPDSGVVRVVYRTSGVGGVESIVLRPDSAGTWPAGQVEVEVRIPGLVRTPHTGQAYHWLDTSHHAGEDDYLFPGVAALLDTIVADWRAKHLANPGVYPMTGSSFTVTAAALSGGGLFDISGTWTTPHSLHRAGTDVDIDNAGAESSPATFRKHCARYRLLLASGDSTKISCQLHSGNHYHVFFDPTLILVRNGGL